MKRFSQSRIDEMAEILRNDGVLSVPTDTVYGVCARMDTVEAQENLRRVKNRPATKAFPIMCADEAQIASICHITSRDHLLIEAFMPGPVTLILKKKEDVPEEVNGGMDTLAIRMATYTPLKKLILALGVPVFMTSANQSGESVCTSLDEIEKNCPLLDGMMEGEVCFGEASTIIDCSRDEVKILRQGPVTMEQIQNVLNRQ